MKPMEAEGEAEEDYSLLNAFEMLWNVDSA